MGCHVIFGIAGLVGVTQVTENGPPLLMASTTVKYSIGESYKSVRVFENWLNCFPPGKPDKPELFAPKKKMT
jgi:hypothetical protein